MLVLRLLLSEILVNYLPSLKTNLFVPYEIWSPWFHRNNAFFVCSCQVKVFLRRSSSGRDNNVYPSPRTRRFDDLMHPCSTYCVRGATPTCATRKSEFVRNRGSVAIGWLLRMIATSQSERGLCIVRSRRATAARIIVVNDDGPGLLPSSFAPQPSLSLAIFCFSGGCKYRAGLECTDFCCSSSEKLKNVSLFRSVTSNYRIVAWKEDLWHWCVARSMYLDVLD